MKVMIRILIIIIRPHPLEDNEYDNENTLDDEDREWKELQKSVKKEREKQKNLINTSHIVHAPYFPAVSTCICIRNGIVSPCHF